MALNPALGHLYHDGYINSMTTALEVQDKIKTREINARESKCLDKSLYALDRAKRVCRSSREREERHVRGELTDIKIRTPTLARSLIHENQRERLKSRATMSARTLSLPRVRFSEPNERNLVLMSAWSVNSGGRRTRFYSAPLDGGRAARQLREEKNRKLFQDRSMVKSAKTANFVKKNEHITRALYNLFNQTRERKWKENRTTVLDILRRESREELETALFVLRGTSAGDVIEDILKEKQMVNDRMEKKKKVRLTDSDENDEIFITQMSKHELESTAEDKEVNDVFTNEETGDVEAVTQHVVNANNAFTPTSKLLGRRLNMNSIVENPDRCISREPDRRKVEKWLQEYAETNLVDVFGNDDLVCGDYTDLNTEEFSSTQGAGVKWMEIFKTPELWKQTQRLPKQVQVNPKTVSLITISGKHRQTLLSKR